MRPKTISPCQVSDCPKPYLARGFCGTHYAQYRKGQLPEYQPKEPEYAFQNKGQACSYDGCTRPAVTLRLCAGHYQQRQMGVTLRPIRISRAERGCRVEGCDKPHEAHGYCTTHYTYAQGSGALPASRRRPHRRKSGYMLIWRPEHPNAHKSGYAYEHTIVMSEALGRPLDPRETVHHINGVRDDNRLENLELWTSRQHKGQRVEDLVAWAKEILARYEPAALA